MLVFCRLLPFGKIIMPLNLPYDRKAVNINPILIDVAFAYVARLTFALFLILLITVSIASTGILSRTAR